MCRIIERLPVEVAAIRLGADPDLLVTHSKLRSEGLTEEQIRKYSELIVDIVKARGIA
jgi:hypothetical protein